MQVRYWPTKCSRPGEMMPWIFLPPCVTNARFIYCIMYTYFTFITWYLTLCKTHWRCKRHLITLYAVLFNTFSPMIIQCALKHVDTPCCSVIQIFKKEHCAFLWLVVVNWFRRKVRAAYLNCPECEEYGYVLVASDFVCLSIVYFYCGLFNLTAWSRVLSEKLTVPQVVRKFPAFYRTRSFITIYTRARHLSLSLVRYCRLD